MTLDEVFRNVYYVALFVSTAAIAATFYVLPFRNGAFTRAMKNREGAMLAILVYTIAFRTGGYREVSWSDEVQYILGIAVFGAFIVASPRLFFAALEAKRNHLSAVGMERNVRRLATETQQAAKHTEDLATETKDAAADYRLTHDGPSEQRGQ